MADPAMQIKDVIAKLTSQHKEVLSVAKNFSGILDDVKIMSNAVKARGYLDEILALLDVHLKIEDKLLYPILKKSPNQKVRKVALDFSDKMGPIAAVLVRYMEKWTTSIYIADESEDFIKETKALISVLAKRIDREDNELFPLLVPTAG